MTVQKNPLQRIFPVFAFASVFAAIALATFTIDRAVQGGSLLWQPFMGVIALYAALFILHHMIERAARNAQAGMLASPQESSCAPNALAAA